MPRVSSELAFADRWGTVKARWSIGRMKYKVDPGLYALGEPDDTTPVLVTANYKMSFDALRKDLPGRNAWILVLDTNGINVWCGRARGHSVPANLWSESNLPASPASCRTGA